MALAALVLLSAGYVQARPASKPPNPPDTWLRGPTYDEIRAAWPPEAKTHGVDGKVVLDCSISPEGAPSDCKVAKEEPSEFGFGAAALSLAPKVVLGPNATMAGHGRTAITVQFDSHPELDRLFDTPPGTVKPPTISELEAVWPTKGRGEGGQAIVGCTVTVAGTLKDCKALWEKPEGDGFGDAALLLTPSLVFKPAMKDGRPVESPFQLRIRWVGDGGYGESYRMVTNLPWSTAPSAADVARAYPRRALANQLSGHVVLRCGLTRSGGLKSCTLITDKPAGAGFGEAAQSLVKTFTAPVGNVSDAMLSSIRIDLPIQFTPPSQGQGVRMLANFDWTRELDPKAVIDSFPGKAADAGLKTGRVVVDCTVAANGNLTACAPVSEDPAGMDFGPPAVQLAQVMAVNPWTQDGLPAEGAHLRFAIRFVRSEPQPAPPAAGPTPATTPSR